MVVVVEVVVEMEVKRWGLRFKVKGGLGYHERFNLLLVASMSMAEL